MTQSWIRPPDHRLRAAFTLIETLLAIGLSSGLMILVFSLVNSTAKYHVTSNDQVLASQRLLGLMQDLRYDLHLVDADPAWSMPTRQNTTPTDDALEEQLLNQMQMQTEIRVRSVESVSSPIRLVGNSRALLVTLSHSNPRFANPAFDAVDKVSDSHDPGCSQILWTHSSSLPLTLPALDSKGAQIMRRFDRQSDLGLLRIQSRMIDSEPANAEASIIGSDVTSNVSSIAFRYFDGSGWNASWNSSVRKSLPVAVELQFSDATSDHLRLWTIYLQQARDGKVKQSQMPGEVNR